MKKFSVLFSNLDQTNKTKDKLALLEKYFGEAEDLDRLWTLALFTHKKPKRTVTTKQLRLWCQEVSGISEWLFDESGRKRGNWWKWKIDPLHMDGVMVYAQKGHGRRADLYSDYTFAVWDGELLVPFAKAYSGLTDKEMAEVDRFVKKNTKERFGPVRTVKPELVFEIAFEGIQKSPRHKSGIALRFPRIQRWRKDKKPNEANTLVNLQELLELYGK